MTRTDALTYIGRTASICAMQFVFLRYDVHRSQFTVRRLGQGDTEAVKADDIESMLESGAIQLLHERTRQ